MDISALKIIQNFFEIDNKIKKGMYDNVPPGDKEYLDTVSLCKYTDNLESFFKDTFSELKNSSGYIFGDDSIIIEKIEELEKSCFDNFYSCGLDVVKLRKFYEQYVSNMEELFVGAVKRGCRGYTDYDNVPIYMVSSINEMLHLIHSIVVNNENVLQAIPVIEQKINNDNKYISLRGVDTEVSRQFFHNLPENLDVGTTDIVALNDKKILMMVGDRGHAMTTEIELDGGFAYIEYFIPKLCNIDMINRLPGINKVTSDSIGATGVIVTEIKYLSDTLVDFILKVPTDTDMISIIK